MAVNKHETTQNCEIKYFKAFGAQRFETEHFNPVNLQC